MRSGKNVVLFSLVAMTLVEQPAPEVSISQGILSGRISADGLVFEYLGIPYATANRSNRFQAPLPPPKWKGVFRATDDSTVCPQNNFFFIRGTEDCLKINVFVPAFAGKHLPVMVYVHGGAFFLGDGSKIFYGPKFLLRKDVILVTLNYRMGVLGFLCLGIEEAPGNAGLKDQLAALRWVKRNINAFGGDPDRITAFGVSAGAASLSLLIASGKVDGLINAAILQSGSAISHWSITRHPVWVARYVLKSLGFDTEDPRELYEILNGMTHRELAALPHEKPVELFLDTQLIHLPCIEKSFPGSEAIITDYPYILLQRNPTNISIIHGTTGHEGLFFVSYDTYLDTINHRNGKYLMPSDLEFPSDKEAEEVSKEIQDFYFRDDLISTKTIMNLSELYKHLHFEVPSIIESQIILQRSNATVYNYYFNYPGNRNYMMFTLGFEELEGASHGDELLYIFDAMFWPFKINEDDERMIDVITSMWTNLAKYGDPTPTATKKLPVKWLPSSKDKLRFLHIDRSLRMADMPSPEAFHMWNNIYLKYRKTRL